MGTADSSLMTGEKCFKWSQVTTTATWKLMWLVERRVEGQGPRLANAETRIQGLFFNLLCRLRQWLKNDVIELIQGNQALHEQNEELERKVIRLERRILPQMEGHLHFLEECLAHLECEGSRRSLWGSSLGSSGSPRSGQSVRVDGPHRAVSTASNHTGK